MLSEFFGGHEEPQEKKPKSNGLMQIVLGRDMANLYDPKVSWYWKRETTMLRLEDFRKKFGQKYNWTEGELD